MTIDSDNLNRVVALANLMSQQAATVERLEAELAAAKANFQRTEQEDLPELMAELELSAVTLMDGSIVKVTPDVHCGITQDRRHAAHEWLKANGFGGLIKTAVAVEFGRGESDLADQFCQQVMEHFPGHAPIASEGVHSATLKSFVKEQLAAGKPVPFDIFGVRPFNRAKVELPKKGKKK